MKQKMSPVAAGAIIIVILAAVLGAGYMWMNRDSKAVVPASAAPLPNAGKIQEVPGSKAGAGGQVPIAPQT